YSIFGFMSDYRDIHTGRHCFFVLYVHLVVVTKYRHQVFAVKHLERMEKIMQAVCDFGAQLREFNAQAATLIADGRKAQLRPRRPQPWRPSDPGPRTSPLAIRGASPRLCPSTHRSANPRGPSAGLGA